MQMQVKDKFLFFVFKEICRLAANISFAFSYFCFKIYFFTASSVDHQTILYQKKRNIYRLASIILESIFSFKVTLKAFALQFGFGEIILVETFSIIA